MLTYRRINVGWIEQSEIHQMSAMAQGIERIGTVVFQLCFKRV